MEKIDFKKLFNKKFLDVFSEEEMLEIYDKSFAANKDCIVIMCEDCFFELSADIKDELDIYYRSLLEDKDGKILTKEEFLEKLKNANISKGHYLEIDE